MPMNRSDRARREKRMTARRAGKAQRARDRGHRTGGQSGHPVETLPLDASARAANYGTKTEFLTSRQGKRIRHKAGHALAGLQR
jgi:hypothetical protein